MSRVLEEVNVLMRKVDLGLSMVMGLGSGNIGEPLVSIEKTRLGSSMGSP